MRRRKERKDAFAPSGHDAVPQGRSRPAARADERQMGRLVRERNEAATRRRLEQGEDERVARAVPREREPSLHSEEPENPTPHERSVEDPHARDAEEIERSRS